MLSLVNAACRRVRTGSVLLCVCVLVRVCWVVAFFLNMSEGGRRTSDESNLRSLLLSKRFDTLC